MRKLYVCIAMVILTLTSSYQTVSNFLEADGTILNALAIDGTNLYAAGNGLIVKKGIASADSTYSSFSLGGSGYTGICTIGDFIYVAKFANGDPGIYRVDQNTFQIQLLLSAQTVGGLAHRGAELFTRDADQVFKVDFTTTPATLVEIAGNLEGSSWSRLGIKIYGDYLYIKELSGISRIDLNSAGYDKEFVVSCTGQSFAKSMGSTFYLTNGSGVDVVYADSGTSTLLIDIPGFIGTNDIVEKGNSLFVTAIEGNFDQVARIDLEDLSVLEVQAGKFVLYPNPAREVLNIQSRQNGEFISIVDQKGQMVRTFQLGSDAIDISDLATGVYFIKHENRYSRFVKE